MNQGGSGGRTRLITFEGGEGAGKSTQIKVLAKQLEAAGHAVLTTREPGGSPGAEEIRRLLVDGEPGRWDALPEALLVSAARRDHVERVVRPALEQGSWVLCDRFFDSTFAYQGGGHGVDDGTLKALRDAACGTLRPGLTVLLDVPVQIGLARAGGRGGAETRFERFDREFHERVRARFLDCASAEPERFAVIDASVPADQVSQAVLAAFESAFTV